MTDGPAVAWSDAYRWLSLDPEELMRQCDQDRFQASGPGGQKRNRVYSAVRLTHAGSGLVAEGADGRESLRNLHEALHRLRVALAMAPCAAPDPVPPFPAGEAVAGARGFAFRLANSSHADFPRCLILALHALAWHRGRLAEAATALGCTGSALTKFLREDKGAWRKAREIREAAGLPPLKSR